MATLDDLKTALQAKAAGLTDDVDRLECLAKIDDYIAIRQAVSALATGSVSSYSINGRSVTKRDVSTMTQDAERLRTQINQLLYGGCCIEGDLRYVAP